jgi:glycosyltransferase involved in cell wall biosynthesis
VPFLFSDKIIFGASDQAQKARTFFSPAKNKIIHLSLIIDEDIFCKKNKGDMRKKIGIPLNKKVIIFIGRIHPLKGSEILKELVKKEKDKLFVLVGKDSDNLFSDKKDKNVLIIDSIPNNKLSEYYSAADLCILPSKTEGFGLVSRESMLCETPALVSDIPSLRVIPGAIVSKNNAKEMSKKIKWLFNLSEKEREKIGKECRDFIIQETSYKILKEKYLSNFYYPYIK